MMRRVQPLARALLFMSALSAPGIARADTKSVLATACASKLPLPSEALRGRLAEAVLSEAGILGSDLAGGSGTTIGDKAIRTIHANAEAESVNDAIDNARLLLEQELAVPPAAPPKTRRLVVRGAPARPDPDNWLFDPARTSLQLTCEGKAEPETRATARADKPRAFPPWALREKVDELALVGDDAKKAGAARISLKRDKTEKDDGSRKTTTTLGITGTLGLRVTPPEASAPVYAYGSYALSRKRTSDATGDESDGDINALEAGLSVAKFRLRRATDLSILGTLRAAYVTDFAKNARRVKFAGSLFPGFGGSWRPLCGLGTFEPVGPHDSSLIARCTLVVEAEGSHVFEAGSADFKDRGQFLALGGRSLYELGWITGKDTEIIASAGFRYMPTLFGTAPDVKRWNAGLKYRFWTESGIGLDFGLSWAKGHEPISLAKEDKLELGFGIIR